MTEENKIVKNFPNSGDLGTPKLRFTEFGIEKWETKRLGEIATFTKGKGISKSDIYENGETECIRYGELYTFYEEVISEIKSKTNTDISSLVLSEANDVIIPASGETQIDIATASCVLKSGVALGGDLNVIKTKNNGVFLSYYLNSKKKLEIAKLSQGVSVVHLYSSQLALLNLKLPQLEEQNKLANFLSLLNSRIQTQKKIIEQLETLMKVSRVNIFSQKLRFKDEHGNYFPSWERKKIKEILTIGSGKDYKHLNDGAIPVYGTGGIITFVDSFLYNGETVCIGRKGTIDKPLYYNGKIWTVDTLFYTHSFNNSVPKFVFNIFQNINWKEYNEASGVPSLSKSTIEKIEISIPCLEEQYKIANFFSSIQQKIDIEKQILEQLELQKKFLLANLFV